MPYDPAVTAVASRYRVIVSVSEVTDVKPVPPKMVSVSPLVVELPVVIVLAPPESPLISKDLTAAFV